MSSAEQAFIDRLRAIAGSPAARGLMDDAAVWTPPPGHQLVLTHDMIVEGVHFIGDEPPADIAWKLVAVNLSDLAAKGATPAGLLLGYMLGPDPGWDAAFVDGLAAACAAFDVAVFGGDTVSAPPAGGRSYGLTAIGSVAGSVPARDGAQAGHGLWVTGSIGDAGLGLAIAQAGGAGPLVDAYRRPRPRIVEGKALVPLAAASTDVSDGLLIDAGRMAAASGVAVKIDLAAVPLSPAARALGDERAARLAAATAGDDYELLLAVAPDRTAALLAAAADCGVAITQVGTFSAGYGLSLHDGGAAVPAPDRLGYEHPRAG